MSNMKYILRLALTLLAITAVMAAALAGVNSFAAPRIAKLQEEKTQQAIQALIEQAEKANKVELFVKPAVQVPAAPVTK